MSVTVELLARQHRSARPGDPLASLTVLPAAEWARVAPPAALPTWGCLVQASSDREAFRIAVVAGDDPPTNGGFLVNGGGSVFRGVAGGAALVWLRAA